MLPFTSSLHTPRSVLVAALALTACAGSGGGPRSSSPPRADASVNSDVAPTDVFAPPGALGALPRAQTVAHGRFMSADRCAFCHEAQGGSALRDARGRDVSPYTLWRGSMMAFSARDPYWLAAFAHEREENPRGVDYIDRVCTRCHAPAGSVAFEDDGDRLTFARITTGTEASSALARDGVTCTACHQIEPTNLGRPESFTGGYTVGSARRIYGPHADPFPMPMQNMVGYTPTHSNHVTTSALCATCHTVITRALDAEGRPTGAEFPEQIPYLEWQDSQWRDEAPAGARPTRCVDCHMPSTDLDGAALRTAIATRPMMLDARAPRAARVRRGQRVHARAPRGGRRVVRSLDAARAHRRERARSRGISPARRNPDGRVDATRRSVRRRGRACDQRDGAPFSDGVPLTEGLAAPARARRERRRALRIGPLGRTRRDRRREG